jgi:hypothetical protein
MKTKYADMEQWILKLNFRINLVPILSAVIKYFMRYLSLLVSRSFTEIGMEITTSQSTLLRQHIKVRNQFHKPSASPLGRQIPAPVQ